MTRTLGFKTDNFHLVRAEHASFEAVRPEV